MQFNQADQIKVTAEGVYHKSAGGFVFYEEEKTHRLFVALIKPKGKDGFFIPKGHIKNGETPKDAATREIREEFVLDKTPEFISEIGVEKYSFTLDNSDTIHFKEVTIFVFRLMTKEILKVPKDENIEQSQWLEFYNALGQMPYDKENLLRARQIYYFKKPIIKHTGNNNPSSISVCIPTFNGAGTIEKTLESVLLSLETISIPLKKEIIVCLDHCTDNTAELVTSFIQKYINNGIQIKAIKNVYKRGKSAAMNTMFEYTNSDLLHFVDDDVILDSNCASRLIEALSINKTRCVFSKWVRSKRYEKNPYKRFWSAILGIKFDAQPYRKPSEYLLGGSVLLLRENYVYLSSDIANEDQFLQYVYWPDTKKINDSFLYFNSVNSILDYYRRFIRIMGSSLQMNKEFSKDRIQFCSRELKRRVDIKKVLNFPTNQLMLFSLYKIVRSITHMIVSIRLFINKDYAWRRIKQGT
ncbi:MAG: glycosyltransferase [Patescibacteria group bacterium]|nr:glycosyltransferase [Patescibacteria group bacterium]